MMPYKAASRAPARSLTSENWRVKDGPSASPARHSHVPPQLPLSPTWRLKDDPQRYNPSTQRAQPHRKAPDHLNRPHDPSYPSSTRLYVGNLLYSVQPHTLTHFFSSAGYVNIDISMAIDPFTGRNPSFCFVDFENEEEAGRALAEMNGREIGGRPVKIGKGVPERPKRRRDGDGDGGGVGDAESAGGKQYRVRNWNGGTQGKDGVLWREDESTPIFDRWTRTSDAPSHWFGQASLGKRLYVGGLPRIDNFTALEAEITKLFSGFKLEAISRLISPDPKRKSTPGNHYFVFVDMESTKEADRAVERLLGAPTWWGGKLKVHRARAG
ncbi:hypothetical protein BGX38DRAFT_119857 [Terfezia claveryi]|nr:hypothetical protein BGX38DRAFT_119857 [Terfezia claveryi]